MPVRERERAGTMADYFLCFQWMLTYRIPMRVEDAIIFPGWPHDDIYYRCPRCQQLLEREWIAYCPECGQHLDWHNFQNIKRIQFGVKLRAK